MQKVNRDKFFAAYRDNWGSMVQRQVDGLNFLLDSLEADEKITDLRHAAYMLATVKHETANTYQPIKEYGEGRGYKYGKPDPVTGKVYAGRGYIQLTWRDNYATFGKILNIDLLHNPDLALVPSTAYQIMSYGMRNGAFTGVGLNRYIHGDVCDYVNARRVINGTDRAELVANYALKFEAILGGAA